MLPIGDHRTGWGWFYHGEEKRDIQESVTNLTLNVPSSVNPAGDPTQTLEGEVDLGATIEWDNELSDSSEKPLLDYMRRLGKSRYRVKLSKDAADERKRKKLLPYGGNKMWFRILVCPAQFDLPEPIPEPATAPWELFVPRRRHVPANISCPSTVRSNLRSRLHNLATTSQKPIAAELQRILLKAGIDHPGGSTRIIDHRLALISGGDTKVAVQGGPPPTLRYYGAHRHLLALPESTIALTKSPSSLSNAPRPNAVTVHYWAGGSQVVGDHDLFAVAQYLRKEAEIGKGAKTVAILAQGANKTDYPATCFLIRKMDQVGLVKIDYGDSVSVPSLSEPELAEAYCNLRRAYLNKDNFSAFLDGQLAFTDMHVFRVDFTCEWMPYPFWRMTILIAAGLFALATFIMALIGVMK